MIQDQHAPSTQQALSTLVMEVALQPCYQPDSGLCQHLSTRGCITMGDQIF